MANTCIEITVTYRIDTDDDLPDDFDPEALAEEFVDICLPRRDQFDDPDTDATWVADIWGNVAAREVTQ